MPEPRRLIREHPILGRMELHNRNGVWWQSEIEIAPGSKVRLDLQAERAQGGVDSAAFFEGASQFVDWTRRGEFEVRREVVGKIANGDFIVPTGSMTIRDDELKSIRTILPSDPKLRRLWYFPRGSSEWTCDVSACCSGCEASVMLDGDHRFCTPVNVGRFDR